jgi:hypothetical protein
VQLPGSRTGHGEGGLLEAKARDIELLDCKALRAELGVTRAAAEAIIAADPDRADRRVAEGVRATGGSPRLLRIQTFSKDQVSA